MRKGTTHVIITGILLLTWVLAITRSVHGEGLSDQVGELLRNRIEAAGIPPKMTVGEEIINASVKLPEFYERRAYQPAWIDNGGTTKNVHVLIKGIREADGEGLRPNDYHLGKIVATLTEVEENNEKKKPFNPRRLVDLDLLLTDAFLLYASHLLAGKVDPETIDPEWHARRREADLAALLQTALESNQIEKNLKTLFPPQPGYARLRQALVRYRELAAKGIWPVVPSGSKMRKGDRSERVAALRSRLVASEDVEPNLENNGDLFDDGLEQAVKGFQEQHGLDIDGVVGPATLGALNVPVEDRVRQIEVNMERWRWLPQDLGERYILVNIANFELDVIEQDQLVMAMRIIVGRDYRRTPVFSDKMTYLVLSPYWQVPPSIAIKDKLPLIKEDPEYLIRENMRIFLGWGADGKEIDPKTIDWSTIDAKNFRYRLRQDPGPRNALGGTKFMFPNKYDVYIHDTPSRELFAKATRAFSSGCIRIEKPIELAEYLLKEDPQWSRETILAAIDKRLEKTVKLSKPIILHLLYWTAWASEDGSVQFRDDIYGRDKRLNEALREQPPALP